MIKNIIFDMGGVLIDFNARKHVDRIRTLEDGSPITEEDKLLLKDIVYDNRYWPALDFGYFESEDQYIELMKTVLPEHLHFALEMLIKDWEIYPVEGMADLIRRLKEAGYNIYLLSNAGPRHPEYWPKIPGSEYFDGVVASAIEKMWKPAADIYELILSRYNLVAEECIFVDDLAVNCAAAWMQGIDSIVFRSKDQLERELAKRDINV